MAVRKLRPITPGQRHKVVNTFDGKKTLLVLGDSNKNVYLSSRNLQHTNVVTASELSTYIILNSGVVLLTEGAVEKIENILS